MNTNNDILELKFEGNGIKPALVKASEIANLISEYENAILTIIKSENPAIDINQVLLYFDSVKNESIGIFLSTNIDKIGEEIKNIITTSYLLLTTSISTSDYANIPINTIASLKKIHSFTKKYNCNANFKLNGRELGVITEKSEIKIIKQGVLNGDTTIYGELIDVGGENPNIHLKINDDYKLTIKTDKQKTKELANRLYDTVGLKGYASWDIITSKILEFDLYHIIDYKPGNVKKSFEKLQSITSGFWDKFNTNEEINNQLLRD